jgi:hypothetical protein
MNYTNVADIKARVKTDWSHGNHKFKPGAFVEVSKHVIPREWVAPTGVIVSGSSYVSQRKQRRVGRVGEVVAVSCTPSGKVRGRAEGGFCERMYTRYYVQFKDDVILGYDSHHLDGATDYRS